MDSSVRRRDLLAVVGTSAVAGCAGLDSVLEADSCSYGEGDTKDEYTETRDLEPRGHLAYTLSPSSCDQLTVTATLERLLDDEPGSHYSFQCRLLDEEMYAEFQRRGEVFGYTGMEEVSEREVLAGIVSEEQRLRYRWDTTGSVDQSYTLVAVNDPSSGLGSGGDSRPIRVTIDATLVGE